MIAAANAALLDLAEVERRAAMAAARFHQPRPAGLVAEQHEILAQYAHLARRVRGVRAESDRMPIAAHQLAHRRATPDLGQRDDVAGRSAGVSGACVGHWCFL